MDLTYTEEEQAFRAEVREWLKTTLPRDLSEKVRLGKRLTKEDSERWHAMLNARGWLAPNWPKEYGGAEWNAVQRQIFEDEACRAHAPRIVPFGLSMLAPVLMAFGTEEQRQRFLPRILNGEDWWCQGYSEPGAGIRSGLAEDQSGTGWRPLCGQRAERPGPRLGQHADWIFCLVRTDPRGQATGRHILSADRYGNARYRRFARSFCWMAAP